MAEFPAEQSADGEFTRQDDAFREWVSPKSGASHAAEAGRYHLYVSLACPWAHRSLIARNLLGLEEAVGVTVVDPIRDERGWAFREGNGHTRDPINGFSFLAEAYRATDPSFRGRVTVPVLWDKHAGRIVNNSEDDICRMLAEAFAGLHTCEHELFPRTLSEEQEWLSQYIYEKVNNGVYRAGFATSQAAYNRAATALFGALDELEQRLTWQVFLLGPEFVEADLRLFCTLIRFDPVYHGHFKCNVRRVRDYPNLSRFVRRLYRHPVIGDTVNFDHIKRHYYGTHLDINPTGIVPIGPDMSWLNEG